MERIIVAFSSEEAQKRVARLLASEGWEAAALCASGAEVMRAVGKLGSAAVICGFHLRDMTAGTLAADLRGRAALMVMAKGACLELCGGENLYKLPTPASRGDFFAALNVLLEFESSRLRRPASQRREEEQRIIRRAKELLMDVNRMSEEEAHRFLQKRSMDSGIRLAEVAQSVVDSYTL